MFYIAGISIYRDLIYILMEIHDRRQQRIDHRTELLIILICRLIRAQYLCNRLVIRYIFREIVIYLQFIVHGIRGLADIRFQDRCLPVPQDLFHLHVCYAQYYHNRHKSGQQINNNHFTSQLHITKALLDSTFVHLRSPCLTSSALAICQVCCMSTHRL